METDSLLTELRVYLTGRGASLVECADLGGLPVEVRGGFPRGVFIGVALDPLIVAGIASGPTLDYLQEYLRVNALLVDLARDAAEFLKSRGFRAVAGEPSKAGSAQGGMRTPLPHKTVATLAGAGWIGRCALLVTPDFGSAIRLNCVLTDSPLTAGEPVTVSRCGTCSDCVTACPAGAPKGRAWEPGLPREEIFDPAACRENARSLCPEDWSVRSICGICIAACPFTRRYLKISYPAFEDRKQDAKTFLR
jgi:epoxyqueuosine reductase